MASKRDTIPYGVETRSKRNSSGPRRRMSGFDEIVRGPMVSPLPESRVERGLGGGESLATAATQQMPVVMAQSDPASALADQPPASPLRSRPAMLPPSMPAGGSSAPPPVGASAPPVPSMSGPSTAGVYRFTTPVGTRRKKR